MPHTDIRNVSYSKLILSDYLFLIAYVTLPYLTRIRTMVIEHLTCLLRSVGGSNMFFAMEFYGKKLQKYSRLTH